MIKSLLTTITFCALGITSASAAVVNGGFEIPGLAPGGLGIYGNGADIGGWTVFGNELTIDSAYSECGPCITFNSFEGSQHLDITGAGNTGASGVYQDISTTVGWQYMLTFYLGNIDGGHPFYSLPSTVQVDVAGVSTTRTNAATSGQGVNWAFQSVKFTATDSTTRVQFTNATPGADNFAGIDAVSVEAVPEPATLALFGLGLAFMGTRRRCRR